jgi:CRP-like cAMP-binding protein
MADFPKIDFRAGDVIFHKGDPAESLFMVLSGEVEIFNPEDQSRIALLGDGASFGEQSLLVGGIRGASARAMIATKCAVINTARLRETLQQEKSLLLPGTEAILLQLMMFNALVSQSKAGRQPVYRLPDKVAELAAQNNPVTVEIFLNNGSNRSKLSTPELLLLRLISGAQLASITIGDGQLAVRSGEYPSEGFIVLQGEIIYTTPEMGLCTLGPGSVIAVAEGVGNVPSRAKAVANGQVLVLRLPVKPLLVALGNANAGLKGIFRMTMLRILDLDVFAKPTQKKQ